MCSPTNICCTLAAHSKHSSWNPYYQTATSAILNISVISSNGYSDASQAHSPVESGHRRALLLPQVLMGKGFVFAERGPLGFLFGEAERGSGGGSGGGGGCGGWGNSFCLEVVV